MDASSLMSNADDDMVQCRDAVIDAGNIVAWWCSSRVLDLTGGGFDPQSVHFHVNMGQLSLASLPGH